MHAPTLYRVIAALLIVVAAALVLHHALPNHGQAMLQGPARFVAGVMAGVGIVVASVLGVAGGELLIPTIVLLFGVDLKLAGSLSPEARGL